MANYGGFNFTGFRGVNLKNTAAIRIEGDSGFVGTLAIKPNLEASKAWYLPMTSGNLGVTGTFSVDLEAINAALPYTTTVVVSGIRAEDALVCAIQKGNTTITTRGIYLLAGVRNSNSGIELTFVNPTATATIPESPVIAYTVVR